MSTPAPTCRKALNDATLRFPLRNRASDGIMGDAAHQQRPSDHNLGNAFDLTHDPDHGVNCNALALLAINDTRVTYVIWNRRIYNRGRAAEGWRPYTGKNPHTHHMHVSIRSTERNNLAAWAWSPSGATLPTVPTSPHPGNLPPNQVLRKGNRGDNVKILQRKLNLFGGHLTVDGDFGDKTETSVKNFQRYWKLAVDGIVGRKSWRVLFTR